MDVKAHLEGFLTVGDGSSEVIAWNRRWCVLNNTKIYFWNYPSDTESKEPVGTLDLSMSNQSSAITADRSICPKPRTLLIETKEKNATKIKRMFLSADSTTDKKQWETMLNMVLAGQKLWNH